MSQTFVFFICLSSFSLTNAFFFNLKGTTTEAPTTKQIHIHHHYRWISFLPKETTTTETPWSWATTEEPSSWHVKPVKEETDEEAPEEHYPMWQKPSKPYDYWWSRSGVELPPKWTNVEFNFTKPPIEKFDNKENEVAQITTTELPKNAYKFLYKVNSPGTQDYKMHQEESNGDSIKGHYSFIESDGTTRVVHYTAGKNGFNADVKNYNMTRKFERKTLTKENNKVAMKLNNKGLKRQNASIKRYLE